MDIGSRIRQSRTEAQLTQEQAAEELGVSRQTVSNWETGKSYPDIVSVLRMSDLYRVSLDRLLKGEESMDKNYVKYLDESTNVVKSRNRLTGVMAILAYLIVWTVSVVVFWCFTSGSDAGGYSLMFLWIILPVLTFVCSLLLGRINFMGSWKWATAIAFGMMYMLAEYATFSLANNLAFHKINPPVFSLFFVGGAIALAGLGVGYLIWRKKNK